MEPKSAYICRMKQFKYTTNRENLILITLDTVFVQANAQGEYVTNKANKKNPKKLARQKRIMVTSLMVERLIKRVQNCCQGFCHPEFVLAVQTPVTRCIE